MTQARVFFPQDVLEGWMSDGRGHVVGETLFLDGLPFTLSTAVRFVAEVAGGGDEAQLVGKVKSIPQIEELGGEHVSGSVVLGDDAYEVVEGFLATPDPPEDGPPPNANRLLKLFRQR
jgi:hypothetical protein